MSPRIAAALLLALASCSFDSSASGFNFDVPSDSDGGGHNDTGVDCGDECVSRKEFCGDGVCSGSEDSTTCTVDCGSPCSDVDKNGVCDDSDADILFWIDASDADSLATSTGAPTDGALVERWADRSIHRAKLVTYNAPNGQAKYVASHFLGGGPGVEFVDAFMEARQVDVRPSVAPQITSIAVVQYLPGSVVNGLWVAQQNAFTKRTHQGTTVNTDQVSTNIFDQSAMFYGQWENGLQTVNDTKTFDENGVGIGVGQWLYAWCEYPGAYHQNVIVGELLIFRGVLSDARREAVEKYLREKWGL